ncbi:hypothetical protein LTR62_007075 [Meristemomyces frigidus]|uniref:alpha-galactosidase n=1 Tax=Meristemomyces frigidus TaxID=1508187 RepID=A0AAN7TBZ1_9PEZI|nr:hypothetical protein LTR62_007075 [Meristemomyces frigidus]
MHIKKPSSPSWQPAPRTTWNYVLSHRVHLYHPTIDSAQVWIVDLFDTTAEDVATLHARGKKVVAYFSAGSYENWRPDATASAASDLGGGLEGWEGEKWLDVRRARVREIMRKRIELAAEKEFDGIDPDNIDAYDNVIGLSLTKQDAIDYLLWLATEAHSRGLSIGLKNGGDIAEKVVGRVQWCVQEQCVQYGDEAEYEMFIEQGKPVFHVEYPKGEDAGSESQNDEQDFTGEKLEKIVRAREMGFSSIVKNVRLDQWVQYV